MRKPVLAAIVAAGLIGFAAQPSAAASRVTGHSFRILVVVARVPPLGSVSRSSASSDALRQAVRLCDLDLVTAAIANSAAIPTTPGAGKANECAVFPLRNSESRLLVAPLQASSALGTPAGLSGRDIQTAGASFTQGTGNAIILRLTPAGATKFDALAAASFGRPIPRDEVAIVVDGLVYAAPAFQAPSFRGPPQITGDFTAGQARSLAVAINASRRERM